MSVRAVSNVPLLFFPPQVNCFKKVREAQSILAAAKHFRIQVLSE